MKAPGSGAFDKPLQPRELKMITYRIVRMSLGTIFVFHRGSIRIVVIRCYRTIVSRASAHDVNGSVLMVLGGGCGLRRTGW